MWRSAVAFSLLASACSGGAATPQPPTAGAGAGATAPAGDACTTAIDKLFGLITRKGHEITRDQRDGAIAECRTRPATDQTIVCLNAAKDDIAIEACMNAPKGEPLDQLEVMTQALRTYHFIHETFTDQKLGPIPNRPCCQFPNKKCPPETAPDEYWSTILELDLSKERDFQYRFESTGNKAVIEAIGDRDCDGKTVTYRRELEWRTDGNMHITVFDPPPAAD
jgi:hypothetical protein